MIALILTASIVVGGMFYLGTLFHELGHLVGALFIGWKPLRLCIGQGKKRTLFCIGDCEFQIGTRPWGGEVTAAAKGPNGFRLSQFTFAAAGPLATGCFVALILRMMRLSEQWESSIPWHSWLSALLVGKCFFLAGTLLPRIANFDGEQLPTDGLLMWRALTTPRDKLAQQYSGHAIHLARYYLIRGRMEEAENEVEKAFLAVSNAQDIWLQARSYWISLLLECGRRDQAQEVCAELIEGKGHTAETSVKVLDGLACIPLFYGRSEMIPEALAYIEQAIAEEPNSITLHGTKGALLIEAGSLEAGMEMLKNVQAVSASANDQAITAYYLALGHHKQGDTKRAIEMLLLARSQHPECIVASRVESKIWSAPLEASSSGPIAG